jgi:hypothetical protein
MKISGVLLATASLALASTANASNAGAGYITNIATNSSGVVSFQHSGARDARPACQTQAANLWVFNSTTPQGQAKLSILLTAYAQHKPIAIFGTGACGEWGDTESMNVMFVIDQ